MTASYFRRLRILWILPCFIVFSSALYIKSGCLDKTERTFTYQSRVLQASQNDSELECIPSGIHSFPKDFLSQEQRKRGGVVVHVLILFYVCAMIARVCDDYFIPALEIISDKLQLPPDVAGATFMAIGASSPELFSSILGSFVTEGDIGVGAVIGSAVFNILGITGVVGILLWNEVLDIDWYPMARDCVAYTITVVCLIFIISDNKVMWWEALILLCVFLLYILLMYLNKRVEKCSRKLVKEASCCCCSNSEEVGERTPLKSDKVFVPEYLSSQDKTSQDKVSQAKTGASATYDAVSDCKSEQHAKHSVMKSVSITELATAVKMNTLCSPPNKSVASIVWWLFTLPASTLLFFTIPDTTNPKCRKFFPVTFIASIAWLGVLSYIAVWMVTIIGYTLSIPDSVSGLTILAVGASVPDLIATVLVAKSGEGNMAMSNLVGSNNFDISICLGIPWIAKALLSDQGFVRLNSSALSYATGILLVTLLMFYLVFQCNGFKLNRSVGLICLGFYAVFLVFACLFEFNVFGDINPPTCYP